MLILKQNYGNIWNSSSVNPLREFEFKLGGKENKLLYFCLELFI